MITKTVSLPSDLLNVRTGADPSAIAAAILDHLRYERGKLPAHATRYDWYLALAGAMRDRVLDRYLSQAARIANIETDAKTVAYLSAEFLTGPHLGNHLVNLGLWAAAEQALTLLGQEFGPVLDQEGEPGLGNGGLGRLAACYMDSLATLRVPAIGYGIRYEFGIFEQAIVDGRQVELTDKWLQSGNPWEIPRADITFNVNLGGHVVRGVAHDTPLSGYGVPSGNLLRLWKAEAATSFDFEAFNVGDYYGAVDEKVKSESISKVLYPNDEPEIGKRLRLAQQYFFVSCSLQDIIRLHGLRGKPLAALDQYWAVQLNDTHPAIAVAELMRLLVDEHGMAWDEAWAVTQRTCGYTNHTLLPEALERWPLPLLETLLPRHVEIIYAINTRFLEGVRRRHPGDEDLARRLSIIDESGARSVRMAHLAAVGSHAINGVAALHSRLLQETVLSDFYRVMPEKFLNVTNGVTPRRWMVLGNPGLSALISSRIGDRWIADLENELQRLEPWADDIEFQQQWRAVKADNKTTLAGIIRDRVGFTIDPQSLFDIQVKRIHEYKRQHLNALYLITLYNRLRTGRDAGQAPRTMIFGGKAAPGYVTAKLIVRLINGVAAAINSDPAVRARLMVVFLPNFNVKVAQRVYPAADLSEQISTAGKEASGTGNMKFAMNGALTIGTLDGANVEIREAVGADNFFLFGLTAEEVAAAKAAGYDPRRVYESNPELREALDMIAGGAFSQGDRDLFRPLVESLLSRDDYMLCADYQAYVDCQDQVSGAYADVDRWTRMAILNTARVGRFSSDRSIREYCRDIWHTPPP